MDGRGDGRGSAEQELRRARDKFFRLLDADRDAPEFLRLYEEFDAVLSRLLRDEAALGREDGQVAPARAGVDKVAPDVVKLL